MNIQQIRNATMRITLGNTTFLTDPWLADKGAAGSFRDWGGNQPLTAFQAATAMPMKPLPCPRSAILSHVDACSSPISIRTILIWIWPVIRSELRSPGIFPSLSRTKPMPQSWPTPVSPMSAFCLRTRSHSRQSRCAVLPDAMAPVSPVAFPVASSFRLPEKKHSI